MLKEIRNVKQTRGEPLKRWFRSAEMDLFLWQDDEGNVVAFQLCFDKSGRERAFTWDQSRGVRHFIVDYGDRAGFKMAPLMEPDGGPLPPDLPLRFRSEAAAMDRPVAVFVYGLLCRHTGQSPEGEWPAAGAAPRPGPSRRPPGQPSRSLPHALPSSAGWPSDAASARPDGRP
jgi:hypothetical protein